VNFLIYAGMVKMMDLKKEHNYKKGDKIIAISSKRVFEIKYILGKKIIVNNGIFDFPLPDGSFVPYSSLMEELL